MKSKLFIILSAFMVFANADNNPFSYEASNNNSTDNGTNRYYSSDGSYKGNAQNNH